MSQIKEWLRDAPEYDPNAAKSGATAPGSGQKSQIKEWLRDAPPQDRGFTGWARDAAAWGVKGAIAVPEAAVGLADLASGGRAGKALESVGVRFKDARELANEWHSEATKEAQRKFHEAEGFGGKLKAALQNPSNIVGAVIESAPSMLAGGVAARGFQAATRLGQMGAKGAVAAGALGEGVVGAGSAAEQIRQETEDGHLGFGQAGAALATGAATAGFGLMGGKLAQRLGIGDVDTLLAQGRKGVARGLADEAAEGATRAAANPLLAQKAAKGIPRQVVEGAISEGLLEELPQSVAEQVLQNLALDKPWSEGVDAAAVMGVLSGGVMGAGAAGYRGFRAPAGGDVAGDVGAPAPVADASGVADEGIAQPVQPEAPPRFEALRQAWQAQMEALQEQESGEPDVPQSAPPDGAAALSRQRAAIEAQREADRQSASPDDEILQSTGAASDGGLPSLASGPVRPSEAMGLRAEDGPLSAAAVQAVDSGVSAGLQQAASAAAGVAAKPGGSGAAPQLAAMTDAELSATFRSAQAPDVRAQLAQELGRRRQARQEDAKPNPDAASDAAAKLREVEARIIEAARQDAAVNVNAGGIEAAMQSRRVPVPLKAQRNRLLEQVRQSQTAGQAEALPAKAAPADDFRAGPDETLSQVERSAQATDGVPQRLQADLGYNLRHGFVVGDGRDIEALAQQVGSSGARGAASKGVRYALPTQRLSQDLGIDLSGYKHQVTADGIAHALASHGDAKREAARGQEAVTAADFARIPQIVAEYDHVEMAGRDSAGNDLIRYRKAFNGSTYYVEEVRPKRGDLTIKTLWKTPTRAQMLPQDAAPPAYARSASVGTPPQGSASVSLGGDAGNGQAGAGPSQGIADEQRTQAHPGHVRAEQASAAQRGGAESVGQGAARADAQRAGDAGGAADGGEVGAGQDLSHLHALESRLFSERQRLNSANTEPERKARQHIVHGIEREIDSERRFLGLPERQDGEQQDALTDDDLLNQLGLGDSQELSSYSQEDLRQREQQRQQAEANEQRRRADIERRAQADAERDEFVLTGSDRAADEATARGQQPMFSLAGDVEAETEAERQFKETERAYGGKDAWEKAKAAGKTKLTYGQWVQVRTPNFKKWFGDWEASRGRRALRQDVRAISLSGQEVSQRTGDSIDMKAMRAEAAAYAQDHVLGKHTNIYSGVTVEVRSVKEALQHHSGPDKLRALAAIPDVLRFGAVVFDGVSPKRPRERLVVIAGRVRIAGQDFLVSAGAREDANGRLFYDHEMLGVEKAEARLSSKSGAAASPGSAPSSASARLNDYTLAFMAQVDADVSQVTDPDTGEPLVVYHGTDKQFNTFTTQPGLRGNMLTGEIRTVQARAKYFTPDEEYAASYGSSKNSVENYLMPVFLHSKWLARLDGFTDIEEYTTDTEDEFENQEKQFWQYLEDDEFLNKFLEDYDGAVFEAYGGTEYVVFDPTQIKSATDNNGDFDAGNPDIRYSISAKTRAAYEARIDALFAGEKASRQGAVLLDRSDVMGLLGHANVPMVLNERHLLDGLTNHPEMTAQAWKRVPEWLENPAAVYTDPKHPGRLTVIAPERLSGYPVVMAVELAPDSRHDTRGAHQLLVTAFAKTTGDLPALGFLASSGRLLYTDTKTAPVAWPRTRDVPRTGGKAHGAKRILTEKNLAGWRKANAVPAAAQGALDPALARKTVALQQAVDAIHAQWENAPPTVVVADMNDGRVPDVARKNYQVMKSRGASGVPRGFYYDGKVYLVASQVKDGAAAARVMAHEVLGHHGLQGLFGKRLDSVLNRIGLARRATVVAKARSYGLHQAMTKAQAGKASDAELWRAMTAHERRVAAEEVLAEMAQAQPKIGFVREAIAAIRAWLRAHMPGFRNLRVTDDEIIREYILPARGWVIRGERAQRQGSGYVHFQLAWHGTPYRGIEKTGFQLNKIGTGEGAQAYGWGIYFASQRGVAEHYRKGLSYREQVRQFMRELPEDADIDEVMEALDRGELPQSTADVVRALADEDWLGFDYPAQAITAAFKELDNFDPSPQLREAMRRYSGQLYQVEVPEDSDLLDWDKPLSEQPPRVREAIEAVGRSLPEEMRWMWHGVNADTSGKALYGLLGEVAAELDPDGVENIQQAASELLREHGIPGLRYLDGNSRADGEGSHNYVIWDEALLTPEAAQIEPMFSLNAGERRIEPVALKLQGWQGTQQQLGALARAWYGSHLQGKSFHNDDMNVDVLLSSEGKGTAFATSGNLRVGWRAEMVRVLPDLIRRAVRVGESQPDARRAHDSRAFHALVAALRIGDEDYAVKLTVREALQGPQPRHKFYDVTGMQIKRSPGVYGFDADASASRPTPAGASSEPTVAELAEAVNVAPQSSGAGPMFSLSQPGAESARLRALKSSAIDQVNAALQHAGTVSWWHKTVGTMRNLAERAPAFKPAFEAAQRFIDDVAMLASDASDRAPRLLPKLETWRDLGKRPVSAQDSKAVAQPLFQGTLSYGRDVDGRAVLTDELQRKYAGLSADDKAQMMLKAGRLKPDVLKMWRGQSIDAYEKAVASRFEGTILKPGVVFSDAELKDIFQATPRQISLYREARSAIDRSIDMTARADMLRAAGKDYAAMRDVVLEAPTLTDAANVLIEGMEQQARAEPDSREALADAMAAIRQRLDAAESLQREGYAPLTRFGKYTLDVVGKDGQRLFFGMYESRRESNLARIQMASAFPGATVTQGTMSDQVFKLFAGVTPESVELFGNMLGLGQGNEAQDRAFQAYLQLTKNNHSAMKRLIHRKGIAGYSEDVGRVLASFVYANARQAAAGLSAGKLEQAIRDIPQEQGELRDVAMGLRDYVQEPQEEGQAIRGMLFAQYLGGSVASAFVNMTQPFAVTTPWLSQYGGMGQASREMARALADMGRRGFKYEADLARAMRRAEEDGIVSPQEIHQLMAQARGAGSLRSGDGTRLGDARAAAANAWERTKVAWGQPFALAEQFNRRSTFIAAYRIAKRQKMADPDEFARRAVLETQFLYSRANKPRWARGAVGGALFTFKTYSVSYLELMQRMWTQGGPQGKRAVVWALAMLMLMSGAGGLPFMEDLEDLIDGIAQIMGYNTSVKQWRKQLLADVVGKELGGFIEQGISGLPGAPVDVSGRLGMGNVLPGTGLFLTKPNRERDVLELVGPAGDLVARGFAGARKALTGDVAGAAMEIAPTAIRNLAKGADMAATGMYRDNKGYKVLDTTMLEAAAKAMGFQPRSVAEVQEGNSFMQRGKSYYQQVAAEIRAQWARALFEKDEEALARAKERLEAWNRNNPDQPMTIRMPDVWKRVREMGKDRAQRIADTAPKALRRQMREMAAEAG